MGKRPRLQGKPLYSTETGQRTLTVEDKRRRNLMQEFAKLPKSEQQWMKVVAETRATVTSATLYKSDDMTEEEVMAHRRKTIDLD